MKNHLWGKECLTAKENSLFYRGAGLLDWDLQLAGINPVANLATRVLSFRT